MKRSPFIALLAFFIIIAGCGALYLWLVNTTNVFKPSVVSSILAKKITNHTAAPEPHVASMLDGSLTTPDLAGRHPLGVMIENHPDARPQSGLSQASVVYEAIAEGGITRFLAIFGPHDSKVGPIRSARTYFADWCDEFDCYYAHVGGNYDALTEKIPQDRIKDIDEFANAQSYHRELKSGLALEHTMYSDTATLYKLATTKKWPTAVRDTYNIYHFLDDPKTAPATLISSIKIDFSTPQYAVTYTFDPTTNSYKRTMAGVAHLDAVSGTQITVKNIIIQHISRESVVTQINEQGFAMPTVGSGIAEIYQGGQKVKGTWKKKDSFSRTEFYNADGKLTDLYAGPTWIEIVNPGSTVSDGS